MTKRNEFAEKLNRVSSLLEELFATKPEFSNMSTEELIELKGSVNGIKGSLLHMLAGKASLPIPMKPVFHTSIQSIEKAEEVLAGYKRLLHTDPEAHFKALGMSDKNGDVNPQPIGLNEVLSVILSNDVDQDMMSGEQAQEFIAKAKKQMEENDEAILNSEKAVVNEELVINPVEVANIPVKTIDEAYAAVSLTHNNISPENITSASIKDAKGNVRLVFAKSMMLNMLDSIISNRTAIMWETNEDIVNITRVRDAIVSAKFLTVEELQLASRALLYNVGDIIVALPDNYFFYLEATVAAFEGSVAKFKGIPYENKDDDFVIRAINRHAPNSDLFMDDIIKSIFSNEEVFKYLPDNKDFVNVFKCAVQDHYDHSLDSIATAADESIPDQVRSIAALSADYAPETAYGYFYGFAKFVARAISKVNIEALKDESFKFKSLEEDLTEFLVEFGCPKWENLNTLISERLIED